MLGNRTISGHEIDDNQCEKTTVESAERADANFTALFGRTLCTCLFQIPLLACCSSNLLSFFVTLRFPSVR